MTYDERQEIETYLQIVEKNIDRLSRSEKMLREAIEKMNCDISEKSSFETAKESFLKQY